jgi:signal transduction histidine kinase
VTAAAGTPGLYLSPPLMHATPEATEASEATRTTEATESRILVLAPTGRDAALAGATLRGGGLAAHLCDSLDDLCSELALGTGGLLLTQEALAGAALDRLLEALDRQPPWSDVPAVVLVSGGAGTPASARLAAALMERANATLLERPVRAATLVGALRVALRARRRQYELRDRLAALSAAEAGERRARADAEQAGRVRDQFMASVAHDLKHPLSAIKGYAQLLRRQAAGGRPPDPQRLAEGLKTVDDMATRATGLLDDLLDLARLQASQALSLVLRPTDLVALARRTAADHQHAAGQHHIRVETALPELLGVWDERRLERVLGNLVSNAIKYSPAGSAIAISVAEEGGGWAVLAVRDQGMGIAAVDLPHVFEQFYRAGNVDGRVQGVGLGLASARQIVEQHGGTISVQSQEGHGATFTVRLPLVPPSKR